MAGEEQKRFTEQEMIIAKLYKDDYLLVDGLHEALVSEEVW